MIDELDSGIYEYLLGECLEVMQDKAKGQSIFTSHNLCPLEILENDSLLYTTVNPENCYIKSSYIKNTQNTRSCGSQEPRPAARLPLPAHPFHLL